MAGGALNGLMETVPTGGPTQYHASSANFFSSKGCFEGSRCGSWFMQKNLAGGALNGLLETVPTGGPTQLDASPAI